MSRHRTPLDRLVDQVEDQVAGLADMLLEGLLVAGVGILAGTAAGKAAPLVADQLRKAIQSPNPKPRRALEPKTGKRSPKRLPAPKSDLAHGVRPAAVEVIDLHPDAQGVYR